MTGHGDCLRFFERLSELIDGELDPATGDEIRAHFESCPECEACFATFSKTVEICKQLGPEPPPPDFMDKLKGIIRESSAEPRTSKSDG